MGGMKLRTRNAYGFSRSFCELSSSLRCILGINHANADEVKLPKEEKAGLYRSYENKNASKSLVSQIYFKLGIALFSVLAGCWIGGYGICNFANSSHRKASAVTG